VDKYRPLTEWLKKQKFDSVEISFDDIEDEDKIGVQLPRAVRGEYAANEEKDAMVRCSRFLPALAIAFAYSSIAPIGILVRMGTSGWRWILNDTAFGFFMPIVFPFAVAVFSCVVDVRLIKRSFCGLSVLTFPLILFLVMLAVLPWGVYLDLVDAPTAGEAHRIRQPYMFQDTAKMRELIGLHTKGFESKDLPKAAAEYKERATAGDMHWPTLPSASLSFVTSFWPR
jgi:hypothetical protein